jgi:DNA repair protein RecO (recombination protein O)
MEYRYTAIVLGKVDVGETDRLYTCMTREAGKIVAKGVGTRKACAKLSGHLETGSLVLLTVMKRKGMGRIVSAICEKSFFGLGISYECMKEGMEVVSLFSRVVDEEERDEELFESLNHFLEIITTLDREQKRDRFAVIRLGFLFQLLYHLGGSPVFSECVLCGSRSFYKEKMHISVESGGVLCIQCFSQDKYVQPLSHEVFKLFRIFSHNSLKSLAKIHLSKDQEKMSNNILTLFYKRLLR